MILALLRMFGGVSSCGGCETPEDDGMVLLTGGEGGRDFSCSDLLSHSA